MTVLYIEIVWLAETRWAFVRNFDISWDIEPTALLGAAYVLWLEGDALKRGIKIIDKLTSLNQMLDFMI